MLGYNEFFDRVELAGPLPRARNHDAGAELGAWRDGFSLWAAAWFNDNLGFEPGIEMMDRAVDEVARQNPIHPVRDYLHGVQWDGLARLDTLLVDLFGARDTPVIRAIGAKWMISAVARVMQPGCQVDHILVLEGAQGTGKSSALRTLVGDAWFRNSPIDLRSKDAAMALRGCWIHECDELDSFRGREATRVKSFLSARVDSYRPAYGRRVVDVPRQCVFAASTNEERYLVDMTGNRRFWPVRCGAIARARVAALRDQLWAEAYARYTARESWHIDSPALTAMFRDEQNERQEIDPWSALTADYLDQLTDTERRAGVTTHQVLVDGLKRTPAETSRADEMRMGQVLKALGCERSRVRGESGGREYRYNLQARTDPALPRPKQEGRRRGE